MADVQKLISGDPSAQAYCDGALINGSPWHCYCCIRLRQKMLVKTKSYLKECNPYNLGVLEFLVVSNYRGEKYAWPSTKHVYPLPEMVI